jgi:hypothetical protein
MVVSFSRIPIGGSNVNGGKFFKDLGHSISKLGKKAKSTGKAMGKQAVDTGKESGKYLAKKGLERGIDYYLSGLA